MPGGQPISDVSAWASKPYLKPPTGMPLFRRKKVPGRLQTVATVTCIHRWMRGFRSAQEDVKISLEPGGLVPVTYISAVITGGPAALPCRASQPPLHRASSRLPQRPHGHELFFRAEVTGKSKVWQGDREICKRGTCEMCSRVSWRMPRLRRVCVRRRDYFYQSLREHACCSQII